MAKSELIADLTLHPTESGGRKHPAFLDLMWPCTTELNPRPGFSAWDGCPLLIDGPLSPGETRRVGFVFLSGQTAVNALREAGIFYLWEGRIIGIAHVIKDEDSN